MRRHRRAILALVLLLGTACYTVQQRELEQVREDAAEEDARAPDVRGWITRDGERVDLPATQRGVLEDSVLRVFLVGTAVRTPAERNGAIAIATVPVAELSHLLVRRHNALGTTALIVVGVVGALALLVAASSCPFIYVEQPNGEFLAVAEPLGGAIAPALQRTDLSRLEGITANGDVYRVLIANEMPETQHIDAFSLVAFDHPANTSVVPGRDGRVWLAAQPMAAARVTDQAGSDLGAAFAADDDAWWSSGGPGGLTSDDRTRDTLTFEFARPARDDARLLVHARTSLWGAEMLKHQLQLWGSDLAAWQNALAASPGARAMHEEWLLREELWLLQVQVLERSGWVTQEVVVGGGPWISESQAVALDLSRVSGEVVRVRIAPPRGYWRLGWAALDATPQSELARHDLAALEAEDWTGADVRAALGAIDSSYVVMPEREQQVSLAFTVPPLTSGMQRTVFARTTGHYGIHLDATRPRAVAQLDSLWMQPGFGVRLAEREHRAWATANPANAFDLF